ncbi:AraC family transcriptional regulator [Chitinophaga nivalis]|uniref:Helix-turn-helix domain-containing protein n=1 Tax=Chitinophaga nivalis TaxID=2991709 RepID=A0ABT3IQT9_9BACT|nr:helix-turn-helix domain-containing protein [Chitinophaga nivalis]MCW3464226.1 helix-turn-helix domain-containing protein [Chitinophaga nivalis]MCW3486084.1 helix-turn-helix domain-containing protein [Chitinophaga nivalis]
MAQKKEHGDIYKQAEFMHSSGFRETASELGLFVVTDINLADYDKVKTYFRSDFTSILLIQQGLVKGTLDRKVYHLSDNDLLLISPNALKKINYVDKSSVVSGLNFTLDFLVEIGMPANKMELYDYFTTKYSPHWRLTAADAQILAGHFKQLTFRLSNVTNGVPFAKECLQHTFFLLMYELASMSTRYTEIKNPNISRKESLVISFTNLVQLHFRHQRNVQQYAELLFVTAKYLTETVKEITGKNAGEIIDDYVILEAKILLENPRLSIAEIAETLHFSDQSFFGKFFKRHTGVSPRTFRATHH